MGERARDRFSINCYFCGEEGGEREWEQADRYNGGDGGHICPDCLEKATRGRYFFDIELVGFGNDPDEAWEDACENFNCDQGPAPDGWEFEAEEELERFIP